MGGFKGFKLRHLFPRLQRVRSSPTIGLGRLGPFLFPAPNFQPPVLILRGRFEWPFVLSAWAAGERGPGLSTDEEPVIHSLILPAGIYCCSLVAVIRAGPFTQFTGATVTKYDTAAGLKPQTFVLSQFRGQKS